jgi:hypothetical protein
VGVLTSAEILPTVILEFPVEFSKRALLQVAEVFLGIELSISVSLEEMVTATAGAAEVVANGCCGVTIAPLDEHSRSP